jgi:AcrR family transcriptional regulator
MPASPARRPPLDRSRDAVVQLATQLLVESPGLSLSDLATAMGIGRTTLHRMFPTRVAVQLAIADSAIDLIAAGYGEAELDTGDAVEALERAVRVLIPLGPQLMFLLQSGVIGDDPETEARAREVDRPLLAVIERAGQDRTVDLGLPEGWALETFYGVVFVAWEQIQLGELAPTHAPALVIRTWLNGVRPGDQRP